MELVGFWRQSGVFRIPGDPKTGLRASNKKLNESFQTRVDELLLREIEEPFWKLVSDPIWKNVDTDMKEVLDSRDGGQRDPAWYAARALESTIKIISGEERRPIYRAMGDGYAQVNLHRITKPI